MMWRERRQGGESEENVEKGENERGRGNRDGEKNDGEKMVKTVK